MTISAALAHVTFVSVCNDDNVVMAEFDVVDEVAIGGYV
jgi:hypothetical protein